MHTKLVSSKDDTTKKLWTTDVFSSGCFNNNHYMYTLLTVNDSHYIMGSVVTRFLGQPQMPNDIVTVSFDSQNSNKKISKTTPFLTFILPAKNFPQFFHSRVF
jgi:hypothetical protein